MLMKTRLVVLIDFSPQTEVLLRLARKWSEIIKSEVLVIHQITYAVPAMADSESRRRIIIFEKNKALAELNILIKKYFDKNFPADVQIFEKGLTVSLNRLLGKEYKDLVIMGTEGTGIFKKYLMGSTALNLIDNLNFTVITVPPRYEAHTPQTLTVAVTYKYPLNRKLFNDFLNIVQDFIESVHFISVVTPDDNLKKTHEYLVNLNQECQHNIPCTYDLFEGESAFKEIRKFVYETPHTMLVVQKGSRSLTDHLFRKFLINELVHDSELPLIVIPH